MRIYFFGNPAKLDQACHRDGSRESYSLRPVTPEAQARRHVLYAKLFEEIGSKNTLEMLLAIVSGRSTRADLARTMKVHRSTAGRRVERVMESLRANKNLQSLYRQLKHGCD